MFQLNHSNNTINRVIRHEINCVYPIYKQEVFVCGTSIVDFMINRLIYDHSILLSIQ